MLGSWEKERAEGRAEGRAERRARAAAKARAQARAEETGAGFSEGFDEGFDEGCLQTAASALLTVLRVRRIAVPDAARERIQAERDPGRLSFWLAMATSATSASSISQVLDA